MLSTILRPDSGTHYPLRHRQPQTSDGGTAKIGLVPQDIAFYPELTAWENLSVFRPPPGLPRRAPQNGIARP